MRSGRTAAITQLLLPALGMAFLWPYFRASFLSFLRVFAVHPYPLINSAYTAYSLVFVLAAGIAALAAPWVSWRLRTNAMPLMLGLLGALGNAALWVGGPQPPALPLCIGGSAAATVFFVGSVLSYGMRLTTWDHRRAAIVVFASFGISFLDNVALALPAPLACGFCLGGPIACALCTPHAPSASPTLDRDRKPSVQGPLGPERTPTSAALLALVILLALFCLTGNVVRGLTNPWFASGAPTMRSVYMSLANLVFAALSIGLLARGVSVRKVLFWNWTACMALFFVGLLGLVLPANSITGLGSDIATVSRVCFTLLMFLFALEAQRWTTTEPLRLLALVLLIPEALSAFVRHIVVPPFLVATGVEPVTAASYAGVVIILVLTVTIIVILGNLLLRQMSGQQRDGAVVDGSTPQASLGSAGAPTRSTDALATLAQTYGLTAREAQTASYVSKGYSLDKTAELLGISINTVRTHMRSVYGKLEIHSRQELIDLLDGMGHV